jgi:multiple sugar transport system permease protein
MPGLRDWFRIPEKFKTLLILPVQIVMNFTAIIPFALVWYIGMTNWSPQFVGGDWWRAEFIGPYNFVLAVRDELFLNAIARTLLISIVCVPIEFLLGFALAYVLSGNFFGKRFFTLVAVVPMMVVPAAGGWIFYLMFIETGPVNGLLSIITGHKVMIPFMNDPFWAMVAIMLADIWQWTPFIFLIMTAALLGLPPEPINAAYVLGATKWYTFRRVVLPMLKRPIMIAVILRAIESLKIFDYPYMMTRGGPGYATQTITMNLYESGFKYLKYGLTNAQCLIIFIACIIVAWYAVKPLRAAQRGG